MICVLSRFLLLKQERIETYASLRDGTGAESQAVGCDAQWMVDEDRVVIRRKSTFIFECVVQD